ncbi:MAG TPA: immunoglobulin domain-containing protein [Verrucomicrobiae bacterium]|jgi:hypothetical protein
MKLFCRFLRLFIFGALGSAAPAIAQSCVLFSQTNAVWRYEQINSLDGVPWQVLAFNDSAWPQGLGLLAAETNPNITPLIHTALTLGRTTYYFRRHFTWPGNPANAVLTFRCRIDDGAVLYLNGSEIRRIRMDPPPTVYSTLANANPPPATDAELDDVFSITNSPALASGDNLIAVEVHQITTNSSDIVWGMSLESPTLGTAPVITNQPVSRGVCAGSFVQFTVGATGAPPVTYQWRKNGVNLPGAINPTLTFANAQPTNGGSYTVVVAGGCGSVLSSVATLSVTSAPAGSVTATADCGSNKLTLAFNVQLDPTTAAEPSNYQVEPGVTVTSAQLLAGGSNVCLFVNAPFQAGQAYMVDILGLPIPCGFIETSGVPVMVRCAASLGFTATADCDGKITVRATGPVQVTSAQVQTNGAPFFNSSVSAIDSQMFCLQLTAPLMPGDIAVLRLSGFASGLEQGFSNQVEVVLVCCERTHRGRDFWLTIPANYAPDVTASHQLRLCITGPQGVSGAVTIPGLSFQQPFTISSANTPVGIDLPLGTELTLIDVVKNLGIHVTATAEISVYVMNLVPYTSDGYLALPSDVVGLTYFVQGWRNGLSMVPELELTQFAIVACADNTVVAIKPSADAAGHGAGVSFTVALNRGDTYQLRAAGNSGTDLSGTFIQADKPIAVFGSHGCAQIPDGTDYFCNYLVEQVSPVGEYGTRFALRHFETRSGSVLRILAAQDGTSVQVNSLLPATINRGQLHEVQLGGDALVTATKPVQVMHYAESANAHNANFTAGDPSMTLIPPTTKWLDHYEVCVPDSGFSAHYLNIVKPLGASVMLGGAVVGGFSATFGGYEAAVVPVLPGTVHRLASAAKFGVTVYGWDTFNAYGYPGGSAFGDNQPPMFNCSNGFRITLPAGTLMPNLATGITDNCTPPALLGIVQQPQAGTMLTADVYMVTISATDSAGNSATCRGTILVTNHIDQPPNTPPVLDAIGGKIIFVGQTLAFTAMATDSDVPLQVLNFTLDAAPPAGASMSSAGAFSWTPSALGTNTLTVRVTDNGVPPLSDSETITVEVLSAPRFAGSLRHGGNIELTWSTRAGKKYAVDYKDDLNTVPWTPLWTNTALGGSLSFTNVMTNAPHRFFRIRTVE